MWEKSSWHTGYCDPLYLRLRILGRLIAQRYEKSGGWGLNANALRDADKKFYQAKLTFLVLCATFTQPITHKTTIGYIKDSSLENLWLYL